MREKTIDLA